MKNNTSTQKVKDSSATKLKYSDQDLNHRITIAKAKERKRFLQALGIKNEEELKNILIKYNQLCAFKNNVENWINTLNLSKKRF